MGTIILCFSGISLLPWHFDGRETDTFGSVDHSSLWQTEGLSEAELLPEHAAIFNLGGWGRPGIALEMTTFYSSPWGKLSMVGAQWDRANKSERGNQQHSTGRIKGHSNNTYVTVCFMLLCTQSLWAWLYLSHNNLGMCTLDTLVVCAYSVLQWIHSTSEMPVLYGNE